MRLLGKGKEPARFPRDIRLTVPPRAPRINYYWNYHASNTSPHARRGLVTCCCLVPRGGSMTRRISPLPNFFSDLVSPSSSQVTTRSVPAASGTAWTPSPRPEHLSPGSCGAPDVRPLPRSIPLSCP